jgi:hypothetical protein
MFVYHKDALDMQRSVAFRTYCGIFDQLGDVDAEYESDDEMQDAQQEEVPEDPDEEDAEHESDEEMEEVQHQALTWASATPSPTRPKLVIPLKFHRRESLAEIQCLLLRPPLSPLTRPASLSVSSVTSVVNDESEDVSGQKETNTDDSDQDDTSSFVDDVVQYEESEQEDAARDNLDLHIDGLPKLGGSKDATDVAQDTALRGGGDEAASYEAQDATFTEFGDLVNLGPPFYFGDLANLDDIYGLRGGGEEAAMLGTQDTAFNQSSHLVEPRYMFILGEWVDTKTLPPLPDNASQAADAFFQDASLDNGGSMVDAGGPIDFGDLIGVCDSTSLGDMPHLQTEESQTAMVQVLDIILTGFDGPAEYANLTTFGHTAGSCDLFKSVHLPGSLNEGLDTPGAFSAAFCSDRSSARQVSPHLTSNKAKMWDISLADSSEHNCLLNHNYFNDMVNVGELSGFDNLRSFDYQTHLGDLTELQNGGNQVPTIANQDTFTPCPDDLVGSQSEGDGIETFSQDVALDNLEDWLWKEKDRDAVVYTRDTPLFGHEDQPPILGRRDSAMSFDFQDTNLGNVGHVRNGQEKLDEIQSQDIPVTNFDDWLQKENARETLGNTWNSVTSHFDSFAQIEQDQAILAETPGDICTIFDDSSRPNSTTPCPSSGPVREQHLNVLWQPRGLSAAHVRGTICLQEKDDYKARSLTSVCDKCKRQRSKCDHASVSRSLKEPWSWKKTPTKLEVFENGGCERC